MPNPERHELIEEENFEFDLESFLSYKNPNMQRYNELIADVEKKTREKRWDRDALYSGIGEAYLDRGVLNPQQKNYRPELQRVMNEKLRDKLLVELGGDSYFPVWFGVDTHIVVDRYLERSPENSNKTPSQPFKIHDFRKRGEVKIIRVPADMLDFVARIPDNSIDNFLMAGIDGAILPNEEYQEFLTREIVRATRLGGIIFGAHWIAPTFLEKNPLVKNITTEDVEDTGIGVYEKVEGK